MYGFITFHFQHNLIYCNFNCFIHLAEVFINRSKTYKNSRESKDGGILRYLRAGIIDAVIIVDLFIILQVIATKVKFSKVEIKKFMKRTLKNKNNKKKKFKQVLNSPD